MKKFTNIIMTIVLLATLTVTSKCSYGQNGQGAILKTLDEAVTINIPEMPINLAVARIAGQSGLIIKLDDKAIELLPYGQETRLRINARQSPLGEILTAMLKPMCLKWSVREQEIIIQPNDMLQRMGRRPSFVETATLASLAAGELNSEKPVLDQLRSITKLDDLTIAWPPSYDDEIIKSQALKSAERQLPCRASEYLDALCNTRSLTWFLNGTKIIIISETRQVERMLGRIISANYKNRPLVDVINNLANRAAVDIRMAPGALKNIPAETRDNFTLLIERSTIAEAFEAIKGATGLEFTPEELAIKVSYAMEANDAQKTDEKSGNDFLLVVDVEGSAGEHYQMLIRPDELPEEMAEELINRKQALIKELTDRYGKMNAIPEKPVAK